MPIANAEIARLLREAADLLEIQNANPFRVRAYRNAARSVEDLARPIAPDDANAAARLDAIPGIGPDLAGKILEIARTGSLHVLEELAKEVPRGAATLMDVPGIGPRRARALLERLHISSLAELEHAAKEGRLRRLPEFGERMEKKILESLAEHRDEEHRLLRPVAAQYGELLLDYLRAAPGVKQAEIAGSFRRCRESIGDLDILVACSNGDAVVDRLASYPEVEEVLARGSTRASVRLRSGLQVDLRVVAVESFGAALHYFTGSKAHNISIRKMGQARGLKINEYGVFRGRRRIAGRTEEEVFESVGLPLIPVELREDRGEIEAAREHRLPVLVELDDIRGDLQCHTTDSDGRDTLQEMAEAARKLGYSYLAVTDHTPSVRVAGGLDRKGFLRQMKRIDSLNAGLKKMQALKGAEVDILADGSLDLDDGTLQALDVVLVAIHSHFDLSPREQTRRIVRALQHPSVDIFAHPTGRLIGRRRGAQFDFDEVVGAAIDHGVMLEVDAQPERLDLDDVSCRAAIEKGATITISTDAHSVANLQYMRWGVEQARRAWATAANVANTRTLRQVRRLLHRER
ncbi:MAG TPA: DNA polymerase/3'-5' exonuclease PolX [Candidatus Kapabacteria bacterium]|nr:DNA polymerase/3'-5' exonuclease PolX [Candidatus Kapabacteria bacterium]